MKLIAGKRNNGAYQLKYTIFLDSHSIANGVGVDGTNQVVK